MPEADIAPTADATPSLVSHPALKKFVDEVRNSSIDEVSHTVLARLWETLSVGRRSVFPSPDASEKTPPSVFADKKILATMQMTEDRYLQKIQRAARVPVQSSDTMQRVTSFPEELRTLAFALHRHLGPDATELSVALWERAYQEEHRGAASGMDADAVKAEILAAFARREEGSRDSSKKKTMPLPWTERRESSRMHVRWLIRRDMPEVAAISAAVTGESFDEDKFLSIMRNIHVVCYVVEEPIEGKILGFAVMELTKIHKKILQCAFLPEHMATAGVAIVNKIITRDYGNSDRKRTVVYDVPAGRDNEEQMLKALGFVSKPERRFGLPDREKTLKRYEYENPLFAEDRVLQHAFGNIFETHMKTSFYGDFPQALRSILLSNDVEKFQSNEMQHFRSWLRTPQHAAVASMMPAGWRTMTFTRTVSDDQWRTYIERQEAGRDSDAPNTPDPTPMEKSKEHLPRMEQIIDWKRHRKELKHLRSLKAIDAVAAKEKAIAFEVFSAIMKIPNAAQNGRTNPTSFCAGMPDRVARTSEVTCFSGPWLMSAMLLKCGIPAEKIFFCNTFSHPEQGSFGGHGSLLLGTSQHELLLFDSGYKKGGQPFQRSFCSEDETQKQLEQLLKGESAAPVSVTVKKAIASLFKLPNHLQILPLAEGITSTHMKHLGLSFFHEKRMEEAREAFEIGLHFNPKNPDILYYLGILAFQDADLDTAEKYFKETLTIVEDHLLAHYSLGELALDRGDFVEMRIRFEAVMRDSRPIWGDHDGSIKKRAENSFEMSNEDLVADWQKRQLTE